MLATHVCLLLLQGGVTQDPLGLGPHEALPSAGVDQHSLEPRRDWFE
jgi:hypothetical protein